MPVWMAAPSERCLSPLSCPELRKLDVETATPRSAQALPTTRPVCAPRTPSISVARVVDVCSAWATGSSAFGSRAPSHLHRTSPHMPKLRVDQWQRHPGQINPLSGQNDGPYSELVLGDQVGLTQFGVRLEEL